MKVLKSLKNLSNVNRFNEKFFIGIIILVLVNLAWCGNIALKQDKYYLKYIDRYLAFKELPKDNTKLALKEINFFQSKEKDNYLLFLDKAKVYKNEKKYNLAKLEYEKAFKKKPLLLENVKYLYLYGEILYLNKDYKEAKIYLNKINKIEKETKYDESIKKMLQKGDRRFLWEK